MVPYSTAGPIRLPGKEGEDGDKKWAIVNKHCGPSCSQHAARGLYSLC